MRRIALAAAAAVAAIALGAGFAGRTARAWQRRARWVYG